MLGTGLERFTIRYLVEGEGLTGLLRALMIRLRPDPHGDTTGRYAVTTLYCEAAEGSGMPRRRLRARLFEGPRGAKTFVEIRHQVGRRSWKLRGEATPEEALRACRGEWLVGSSRLLQEAAALARDMHLEPACLVAAERRAFVAGETEEDLRVTIDSHLRHRVENLALRARDDGPWQPMLPEGVHLVEVRVARAVPPWLIRVLERAGCTEHAPGRRNLARQAG